MALRVTSVHLTEGELVTLTWDILLPVNLAVVEFDEENKNPYHTEARSTAPTRVVLRDFGKIEGRHYVWKVDLPAGTTITFELAHEHSSTPTALTSDAYMIKTPTSLRPPPLRLSSSDAHLISIPDRNRPVGGGGYCDLFLGIFIPTSYKVALKRPRFSSQEPNEAKEALRRLKREGKLWSDLRHVNILPFYGLMDILDETYLVSPWVKYGDLSKFVPARMRYRALPEVEKGQDGDRLVFEAFDELKVVHGIASGIAYLHSRQVIHGDIKAANILLDHELVPALCDFGMTKVLDGMSATSTAMKGAGSVPWMSPELLDNEPRSAESDIYALGVTIGE
ncbi:hypothetical protein FRB98_009657, partial [Tulasnella sp. 332]